LGNDATASIERARFCTLFCVVKLCFISLDPELERNRNRNRKRNRHHNLSKVGTGTAINHYGSTRLVLRILFRLWATFFFIEKAL
jgi:hypothetical protein